METIPTALDYIYLKLMLAEQPYLTSKDWQETMIKFAKIHVTEALNEASIKAELNSYEFKEPWMEEPFNCTIDDLGNITAINKDSILNAYSLDNIK